ncbi:nucleotidyltransferase domain-containing protein [Candidatus Peregrinibacteria bacterium]|nr:nucleotidyltransferase domain-containing protein [Candidatus Peregrinibacteria bacterium]MBI3816559.1 nucleotidyltransferase domain-containing protein [Candidatus Peregrinibacteria bacterium]
MHHNILTKERGLAIAKRFKKRLNAGGIPVVGVYLFGSLAHGKPHRWTDVDIAVVHEPFAKLRSQERRSVRSLRDDFSVPMDIVCLRSEDLKNDYLALAKEVREHGVPA